jgi:disulfide bond formation protein DsbB
VFTRTIVPAALALALIGSATTSFAETVYQGGPKGIATARPVAAAVQTNMPYAQALPGDHRTGNKHIYSGGPKTQEPHGR